LGGVRFFCLGSLGLWPGDDYVSCRTSTEVTVMAKEPDEAAIARAARLREQIGKLTNPAPDSTDGAASGDKPAQPESPRDFVHRRMRELDGKD
jgi:hypothetical protein